MGKVMIEVSGLVKSYGAVKAVQGIDFTVHQGSLFAFLGPNGAGKSTTIDIICTLLKPDEGRAVINGHVLGKDDAEIRKTLGVVFQHSVLDNLLTVEENLYTRGRFYGLSADALKQSVKDAAQAAGVTEFLHRPYGKLSGGQRRRADIARALVNTPDILFLDEPTTGLDPQTRKNVWEIIKKLQKEKGMTVFMTTHYMEEAAEADWITVIDQGKISAEGSPEDLKLKYSSDILKMKAKNKAALKKQLDALNLSYRVRGDICELLIAQTMDALPILDACRDNLVHFEVVGGTMDDVFIAITGRELREV